MPRLSKFQEFLFNGWKIKRSTKNEPTKLMCPRQGCPVTLSFNDDVAKPEGGYRLWSVQDVANALSRRRAVLGVSLPELEERTLLPDRYGTKLEATMRNQIHRRSPTFPVMINAIYNIMDRDDVPQDAKNELASLIKMANRAIKLDSKGKGQPPQRMPRVDTLIFLINALGGELMIHWPDD